MAERLAKAQGAPVYAPRRLIIMFTHYGCLTDRWFPTNSHGELSADFVGTSLESLAPHAAKILLPRGIRAMNEWTFDASLGQGNDPYLQVAGSFFTCALVSPHNADPFQDTTDTRFQPTPIVQAGSCGGYFKTGCAVNVDGGASDLHRGNSSAACEIEGRISEFKQTGTPSEFGNAPIQVLLQPDECHRNQSRVRGFPSRGRHRGGNSLRHVR